MTTKTEFLHLSLSDQCEILRKVLKEAEYDITTKQFGSKEKQALKMLIEQVRSDIYRMTCGKSPQLKYLK